MRHINWKQLLLGAGAGFVLGFLVLHPFSMLFQGMELPKFKLNYQHLAHAFNLQHLPMAFFFGVLGFAVGSVISKQLPLPGSDVTVNDPSWFWVRIK